MRKYEKHAHKIKSIRVFIRNYGNNGYRDSSLVYICDLVFFFTSYNFKYCYQFLDIYRNYKFEIVAIKVEIIGFNTWKLN